MFSKKTKNEKIVKSNRAMDAVGDLTFQDGLLSSAAMDAVADLTFREGSLSSAEVDAVAM